MDVEIVTSRKVREASKTVRAGIPNEDGYLVDVRNFRVPKTNPVVEGRVVIPTSLKSLNGYVLDGESVRIAEPHEIPQPEPEG